MTKTAPLRIRKLRDSATYEGLKAWQSSIDDWLFEHTQVYPDKLGPAAVRSVARMTIDEELYAKLQGDGAIGGRGEDTRWETMLEHIRDRLGCNSVNLRWGLAFLKQGGMSAKDYAWEFERRARDAELSEVDAKVFLVGNLNPTTLARLDTYVTARTPSGASRFPAVRKDKESVEQRLGKVPYGAMIGFLKESNLTDLALSGAGGTGLKRPATPARSANTVQAAPAEVVEVGDTFAGFSGFTAAGVFTLDAAAEQAPKPATNDRRKGKKTKGKQAATSSPQQGYQPVSIPSREEMIQVYTVGLAAADVVFPAVICNDPLPMLACVMGILSDTEASDQLPEADKKDVSEAITYLAERIATVTKLVDPKSPSPSVNVGDVLPRGDGGRRRGPSRTMLFDVARGLARRVPLTKLAQLDGDVRPYLAALMVSALHRAGDSLIVPDELDVQRVTRREFENMLAREAGKTYDNYGTISEGLVGPGATFAEAEQIQRDRMEQQIQTIAKAVQQLTKDDEEWTGMTGMSRAGKGAMDVSAVLQTEHGDRISAAVVHVAKTVEDNICQVFAGSEANTQRTAQPNMQGALQIKQVRRA